MERTATDGREKVAWAIVGLIIVAFVGYVLYSFVGALVVGIFLYYATRPVYRWLNDRIDHPDVNAAITLLAVGLPLLIVLGYAVVLAAREAQGLLDVDTISRVRTVIQPYAGVLLPADGGRLVGLLRNNLSRIVGIAEAAFTWSLRLFVAATVAFYLLRDDRKIARWFRRSVGDRAGAVTFMEHVDDDLTTIYTGNLLTIGITAIVAAVTFFALGAAGSNGAGLDYPIALGLLTGVATLIPAVGMKLVYFPYTAYLFWLALTSEATPLWFPVAFFVLTLVVVDSVPDFFIRSYVSKGDIHMGLMLLTYVLGAIAFGWYGVFFGPIVLVFFVHFARDVFPTILDGGSTT